MVGLLVVGGVPAVGGAVVDGMGLVVDGAAPVSTPAASTAVGRSVMLRVTLTPAAATTRAASTVQRVRRIDVLLMPDMT